MIAFEGSEAGKCERQPIRKQSASRTPLSVCRRSVLIRPSRKPTPHPSLRLHRVASSYTRSTPYAFHLPPKRSAFTQFFLMLLTAMKRLKLVICWRGTKRTVLPIGELLSQYHQLLAIPPNRDKTVKIRRLVLVFSSPPVLGSILAELYTSLRTYVSRHIGQLACSFSQASMHS